MYISHGHSWFICLKFVLTGIFTCLALSCTQNTGNQETGSVSSETDSILRWVENSRNENLGIEERKKWLQKAENDISGMELDSIKLKYLSKMQWAYLELRDSISFRKANQESIYAAQLLSDSLALAGRYWDLAYFLELYEVKDSAYYNYARAEKIFRQKGNLMNSGIMLIDMANIQMEIKDYTGGEINAVRAIKLLKPLNNDYELYRAFNVLGVITKDLKEYERSLAYYQEARSYLKKLKNKDFQQIQVDNNLGVVYREMGEYKKALSYFNNIIQQDSLDQKMPLLYARALANFAESQLKIDPNSDVRPLFEKALKIRDSIGDISGKAASHYHLAKYFIIKNDTLSAITNAKLAKDFAEQSDNNERLLETLALLIHIDSNNASTYTHQYFRISDSLQLAERKMRDKFTRIQFETDEVVAKNVTLTKQIQFWVGIAIGLLLMGLSIYLIADQRIKNQKLRFQQQQQTNNQEIFNLMLSQSQKLEEGKKLEQKRISEELHDGVLGKMLGARMLLTGLNKKSDDTAITQRASAIEALKNVESEVRSISHELSHAAYQKIHNFISSIQDLLDGIGQNAQIECNFTYSNNLDWDGLKGDIKINVYRIVQECLQNTIKHADCEKVKVDFNTDERNLKINIVDDGKGYDIKKAKRGIGIRNIESRVMKLNGIWKIDSNIGKGTSIAIDIPIKYYTNSMEINDDGIALKKV